MRPYTVRVAYVTPQDSPVWEHAKTRANVLLEGLRQFFAFEMNRHGHGKRTFEIARDEDGTLLFHQITSPLTPAEFAKAPKKGCKDAANEFGVRTLNRSDADDVIIFFYEHYSVVEGQVNAGARGERRGCGGEVFLSSLILKTAVKEWLTSDKRHQGEVFDLHGYPLKWNGRISDKLADISGAAFGITAHEFVHCFGEPNDRSGNRMSLMGRGYRFMGRSLKPHSPSERCELSRQTAAHLASDPFFKVRQLTDSELWVF